MKVFAWTAVLGLANGLHAQSAWLPLSREVERPYAIHLARPGYDHHTAIRPYRLREVTQLAGYDTLRPRSFFKELDKWAGVRNGRTFRWGPLADATMGWEPTDADGLRHRAGGGAWLDFDATKNLTFHLDAQVWNERFPGYLDSLVNATQVAPAEGYAFGTTVDRTHYDINGHVSWDPGKFFNLTLGRGRNFIGEGYRSLMLSNGTNSYPYFRITTSVWRIRYVNLFAQLSDIRGADGDPAKYHRKYTSMHYLSWNVSKRVNVGVYEAIHWSSGDSLYPRGFDLNYVNPVIFYRPVEFDIGSPDNALLGLALNVKAGRHTVIYSQFVLDEFLLDQVRSGLGWYANKQSAQVGFIARNAFRTPGLDIRCEWNFVRPFMYTHSDTRQNHSHHGEPLAHPYGSNFQEALVHVERSRDRWLYGLRTSLAWLGSDTEYSYGNNIFRPESDRPVQNSPVLQNFGYAVGMASTTVLFHGEARAGFLVDPATGTRLEATYTYRLRDPEAGTTTTTHYLRLGLVCHFRDRHPEQEVRYVLP